MIDLLAEANAARQANRPADAIRLYQQVVRAAPSNTEAWWYLGMLQYEAGDAASSAEAFRKVTAQQPKRGAGWAMLGLAQYGKRDYPSALTSLRTAQSLGVPALNNLDKVALYHLAALLNRSGEHDLSSGLLMSFVSADAVTPRVTQAAGIAALRLTVLPEEIPEPQRHVVALAGEAAILAWRKHVGEARVKASELLRQHPDQPNANYLMGYVLLLANDEASVEYFQRELKRDPEHVPARLQIAYELLRRGQGAAGLRYAAEAVKRAPENFVARNIHGRILLDAGQVPAAIHELEAAVKLQPHSSEAHLHLASAYTRAGRKTDAAREREIFSKLEQEQPKR